jgi:hypothetical protein
VPEQFDFRSRKSISVVSQPDSVVSVVEAATAPPPPSRAAPAMRPPDDEEPEPRPMSERGRPTERRRPPPPAPHSVLAAPASPPPPPAAAGEEKNGLRHLVEQESMEEQAPPLEEMEPPVRTAARAGPSPPAVKAMTPMAPGRRGQQVVNREPSVGTDRYEEIIVETRQAS